MKYLFSEAGEALLRSLVRRPFLVAFDYDGTLAPIVPRPDRARLEPGTARLLERLCRLAPVAIVTGRSLADVRRRLPDAVHYLVGNHGIEGPGASDEQRAQWYADCRAWLAQLEAMLPACEEAAGVQIEDKALSLSVHYRLARDHAATERALAEHFARLSPPPRVVGGKCVFNLVPSDAPNKRDALHALVRSIGAHGALFAGDDVTDEDVFEGAPPSWVTVRVERSATSAARWYVHRQSEINVLLTRLVGLLDPATRRLDGR